MGRAHACFGEREQIVCLMGGALGTRQVHSKRENLRPNQPQADTYKCAEHRQHEQQALPNRRKKKFRGILLDDGAQPRSRERCKAGDDVLAPIVDGGGGSDDPVVPGQSAKSSR